MKIGSNNNIFKKEKEKKPVAVLTNCRLIGIGVYIRAETSKMCFQTGGVGVDL